MPLPVSEPQPAYAPSAFQWKLWIYTNYDCNLRCSYCVAKSSPNAPRRAIGLANVQRLVDEAVALGFDHVFFTGGEPFLLNDIYDMLAYSSARVKTTVLTNAMLLHGARLDKLCAIAHDRLIVQASLDGGRPEDHDAYRGTGTWEKTVEGINAQRAPAAATLGHSAAALHHQTNTLASVAHATADKLQTTADYVRTQDVKAMAKDVGELVRRYPGSALALAAAAGFIAARVMRSRA